MEERREKCSGKPERSSGGFPYRPSGAPRLAILEDNPTRDDPTFDELRAFVQQRKNDAELARHGKLVLRRQTLAAIDDAKARRELERRDVEIQRGIDDFWRNFKRPVTREKKKHVAHDAGTGEIVMLKSIALPSYSGPIRDRQGRVGMFMSSTYLGAKTASYGCARRLVYYITNGDSVEEVDGAAAVVTNMGEDRYEMAAGMSLVEDANRAGRANGKVVVTFIVQLPHDVSSAERLLILRTWCEEHFGAHDLPFVAACHKPSAEGDPRNFHAHVVMSFRPAYRAEKYQWCVARAVRTELDNPEAFGELRRNMATIMTAVAQVAGKERVYTALSHAARRRIQVGHQQDWLTYTHDRRSFLIEVDPSGGLATVLIGRSDLAEGRWLSSLRQGF